MCLDATGRNRRHESLDTRIQCTDVACIFVLVIRELNAFQILHNDLWFPATSFVNDLGIVLDASL